MSAITAIDEGKFGDVITQKAVKQMSSTQRYRRVAQVPLCDYGLFTETEQVRGGRKLVIPAQHRVQKLIDNDVPYLLEIAFIPRTIAEALSVRAGHKEPDR